MAIANGCQRDRAFAVEVEVQDDAVERTVLDRRLRLSDRRHRSHDFGPGRREYALHVIRYIIFVFDQQDARPRE